MRTVTGTLASACALAAALTVAGCGGHGDRAEGPRPAGAVLLQAADAPGPDPFVGAAATVRGPEPLVDAAAVQAPDPSRPASRAPRPDSGVRATAACDTGRQLTRLGADPARNRAFARAAGVPEASVPGWLRGLAPVELRADTRVTGHGYRDGRATTYQALLRAGTAVLADGRGEPRVRCLDGNPLGAPEAAGAHETPDRPREADLPAAGTGSIFDSPASVLSG